MPGTDLTHFDPGLELFCQVADQLAKVDAAVGKSLDEVRNVLGEAKMRLVPVDLPDPECECTWCAEYAR